MICARFSGQGHNITTIQANATNNNHSDDKVEDFYKTLQHRINNALFGVNTQRVVYYR